MPNYGVSEVNGGPSSREPVSVPASRAEVRACVVGLGYVGLPLSILAATSGIEVIGVDVQEHVVAAVNAAAPHIVESGLQPPLSEVVREGRLRAAACPTSADVFLVAVPTPVMAGAQPDLAFVEAAFDSIAPFLAPGNLVLLESTCPIHTTERMCKRLQALRPDLAFPGDPRSDALQVFMAYCPERVLPGSALREMTHNDRVVGGLDEDSSERAAAFYRHFVRGALIRTDARTAEMCKLAENTFRDVNIALANELARICDSVAVDPFELIAIANQHPRVNILQPGPGVGGHCIAVDPWFLVHTAPEAARLIRTAREINDARPHYVADQIAAACDGLADPVVACLGLSYKPDVDDMRESPAVEVVLSLAQRGTLRILAAEPFASTLPAALSNAGVELVDVDRALEEANVVVLLVHHSAFRFINRDLLRGKHVIDTRGIWRSTTAPSAHTGSHVSG